MTSTHLTRLGISALFFGALTSACIFVGDTDNGHGGSGGSSTALCGNGKVDKGEECDEGAANADTGACSVTCKRSRCGDGIVAKGVEACDDGNQQNGDGCNNDCVV